MMACITLPDGLHSNFRIRIQIWSPSVKWILSIVTVSLLGYRSYRLVGLLHQVIAVSGWWSEWTYLINYSINVSSLHKCNLWRLEKFVTPAGTLPKGKKVIDRYAKKVGRRVAGFVPEDVVRKFVKIRLIIRMKYIIKKGELKEAHKARNLPKFKNIKKVFKLSS